MDFLLINEVSKEVDKYRYSTYFYKKKDSKGGEIFAGPIWDFNLDYANVDYWNDGLLTSGWLYSDVKNVDYSIMFWWKRLMEDEYFNNIAVARYKELRQNEWTDDQVSYLIDSIASYVDDAKARNYSSWPILGTYVWPNMYWSDMTYTDEVATFKAWILDRLAWMDDNLIGDELQPELAISVNSTTTTNNSLVIDIQLSDDYFNHQTLKTKYFDIKHTNEEVIIDTVLYTSPTTATMHLSYTRNITNLAIEVDDNIITGFNDIISDDISAVLGINTNVSDKSVEIYTTTNTIILAVDIPNLLNNKMNIYNIQGQKVMQCTLTNTSTNNISTNLSRGIYIISIQYNNTNINKRMIIE